MKECCTVFQGVKVSIKRETRYLLLNTRPKQLHHNHNFCPSTPRANTIITRTSEEIPSLDSTRPYFRSSYSRRFASAVLKAKSRFQLNYTQVASLRLKPEQDVVLYSTAKRIHGFLGKGDTTHAMPALPSTLPVHHTSFVGWSFGLVGGFRARLDE